MRKKYIPFIIVPLILILDQWLKIWVKTTLPLYGEVDVFGVSWFKIHFIENEGMAFGLNWGGDYGKLFLTLFRIFAVFFISFYLYKLLKKKASVGLVVCISLILAGAVGNIVDSVIYGVIFSDSYPGQVAAAFPEGGGYGKVFYGKVVDMFSFSFFPPVFNFADSAITCGVIAILLFQKQFFGKGLQAKSDEPDPGDTLEAERTEEEAPIVVEGESPNDEKV